MDAAIWTAAGPSRRRGSSAATKVMQWQGRRFHLPRQRQPLGFAGAKAQLHQTQEWNVAIYSEDIEDTKLRHRQVDIFTLTLALA